MGQMLLSETAATTYLCERLLALGKKSAPSVIRPSEEVVEGESFRAFLRLVADHERADGSLCTEVRLLRRGVSGRHRERYLYVRREEVSRRLDRPRTWRKALGRTLGTRRAHHHKLTLASLSRDILWGMEIPFEVLEAQVVIALCQLGLMRQQVSLEFLSHYLRSFLVSLNEQIPFNQRTQARDAIRWIVAGHLLKHWSFPEHWRAFRKYVRNRIRLTIREQVESFDYPQENAEEPHFLPAIADGTLVERVFRSRQGVSRQTKPGTEDQISVARAADSLGWSPSYVHRLIRQGVIRTVSGRTRAVSSHEFQRLRYIKAERTKRQKLTKSLQQSGKSPEAARKAVYRIHGPSPRVSLFN